MTASDAYLLSPEISMAGLAVVVILADLFVRKKGVLAFLTVVGLAVPTAFCIALWVDIAGEPVEQRFLELGQAATFAVDHFALFFKLLVIAVVGLVVLASQDYASRFSRYRGEYYALILLSATGMMLLAATTELVTIYVALELATLPLVVLAAFLRDAALHGSGDEVLRAGGGQLGAAPLRHGAGLRLHGQHAACRHRRADPGAAGREHCLRRGASDARHRAHRGGVRL